MRYIFYVALLLAMSSCEKKLTRDEATNLIRGYNRFPIPVVAHLPKYYGWAARAYPLTKEITDYINMVEKLQRKNLVNYNEEFEPNPFIPQKIIKVTLTPEGRKYFVSEDQWNYFLKIGELDLETISGMIESDQPNKHIDIEYQTSVKNDTPFYEELSYFDHKAITGGARKATIVKYDDGWRVQKNND